VCVAGHAQVDAGAPACPGGRSSTRTICLVGLAPTARANAASSTANSGMANADGEVADDATWQSEGGMDEAGQIALEEAMLPRSGARDSERGVGEYLPEALHLYPLYPLYPRAVVPGRLDSSWEQSR